MVLTSWEHRKILVHLNSKCHCGWPSWIYLMIFLKEKRHVKQASSRTKSTWWKDRRTMAAPRVGAAPRGGSWGPGAARNLPVARGLWEGLFVQGYQYICTDTEGYPHCPVTVPHLGGRKSAWSCSEGLSENIVLSCFSHSDDGLTASVRPVSVGSIVCCETMRWHLEKSSGLAVRILGLTPASSFTNLRPPKTQAAS